MQEYIVILQSCLCSGGPITVHYGWDGERFATRVDAIKEGFERRGSDDFNIGVVERDRLVSFDWMQEPIGEDEQSTEEIAQALGLWHIKREAS